MNENQFDQLKSVTNQHLLNSMHALVKSERKITHAILLHINEIEIREAYEDVECASMFEYLTKHEGYSSGSAYRRLDSARLLRIVPEVGTNVKNGSLNLTQLSQLQAALRQEKKKTHAAKTDSSKAKSVASLLVNQTQRQSELILAREFDTPVIVREKTRIQKDESLRIEITVSSSEAELLEQIRSQTAHQNPSLSWKELFLLLARKELKKYKPKKKCEAEVETSKIKSTEMKITEAEINANEMTATKSKTPIVQPQREAKPLRKWNVISKPRRRYISIHWRREMLERAGHQCEHIYASGERCCAKPFLQFDHVIPLACGGPDEFENFRVLCQKHNLKSAKDWGLRH